MFCLKLASTTVGMDLFGAFQPVVTPIWSKKVKLDDSMPTSITSGDIMMPGADHASITLQ